MKLEITLQDNRWLVNGKKLSELNPQEERFMNDFFREVKIQAARESQEVTHFINSKAAEQYASINYAKLLK